MVDTLKEFDWITETEQEFQPRFRRNDVDADMYNQIEYQLRDLDTKQISKDVVNFTSNDAKVFADRSQAFMNEASMQRIVEGRHLNDKDTTLIENFDADMTYEIDTRLLARDISSRFSFLVEQAVIRGTLGARYVSWEKDGEFVPDFLPCDSRYLLYEYGDKDLARGAFKTIRSKSAIEKEYGKDALGKALNFYSKKRGGIWEEWTTELWRVWLSDPDTMASEGQLIQEKENVFGYVPMVIQGVGAGSMLQDERSRAHRFESIFANNRLLYEHLNMLGSILQTLNYMTFNRVHLWESDQGVLAKKPPKPGSRKTLPIDKGTRGLFPMEVADIKNATRLFYALLLGAVQRGSLPNIDYGNLTFPLSAVAISKLTSQKDAIFSPRLQAISFFLRKLHYMIRDQYVDGGYEAEIGEEGLKRTYKASDLEKKYKISYKFHSTSPEQDIANYSVAQVALDVGMSQHTVFRDIIKVQDPAGEIMKGKAERSGRLTPVNDLIDSGLALIDQGTQESFIKADAMAMTIENMVRQPQMAEAGAGQKPQSKGLVDLFGGGGSASPLDEDEGMAEAPEQTLNREERREETVRKNQSEG